MIGITAKETIFCRLGPCLTHTSPMTSVSVPFYLFDRENDGARERRVDRIVAESPAREPALLCARCRHTITQERERIAVSGAAEHDVVNPHGFRFHIGCFRHAPGCTPTGDATTEYTWFPGYAWRLAQCGQCRAHLGWHYTAQGDSFFGLILDRLRAHAA